MKLAAVLVCLAAAVSAAPAPEPEPEAFCGQPGQPCAVVKRVAEAFASTMASFGGLEAREVQPTAAGAAAKRSLDNLASHISLAQRDPTAYYNGLSLYDIFGPDFYYGPPPAGDDDAAAAAEKRSDEPADKRWCGDFPHAPCWKAKRAAEAVVSALESVAKEKKREASPEPWCGPFPHSPCWKRDVAFNPLTRGKREATPEQAKRWCGPFPHSPCWRRDAPNPVEARCNAVDGACSAARRDLAAIELAARSILADN